MTNRSAPTTPGAVFTAKLRPLIGKRVESVRVDEHGAVHITAAGLGGRVVVQIGQPWRT